MGGYLKSDDSYLGLTALLASPPLLAAFFFPASNQTPRVGSPHRSFAASVACVCWLFPKLFFQCGDTRFQGGDPISEGGSPSDVVPYFLGQICCMDDDRPLKERGHG
jgi:hypothetical protein